MSDDTLKSIVVATFVAVIGFVSSGIVWLVRLGSRVALLEQGHRMMERTLEIQQRALASGLRDIRNELKGITSDLAKGREEALRYFVAADDLRRVEGKVDELLASLTPASERRQ